MNKILPVAAGIIAVLLAAAVTIALYPGQPADIPHGKYVLLEHQVQTLMTIPGDNDTTKAYAYLGYPSFSYDQSVIAAKSLALPPINESLKAIYQYGNIVGPGGCHGASFNVSGVYGFPYLAGRDDGLEILSVDRNGVAHLEYNGKPVILEPNGVWYNNTSELENILPLNASGSNSTNVAPLKVNVSITDRITNYGIYDVQEP